MHLTGDPAADSKMKMECVICAVTVTENWQLVIAANEECREEPLFINRTLSSAGMHRHSLESARALDWLKLRSFDPGLCLSAAAC